MRDIEVSDLELGKEVYLKVKIYSYEVSGHSDNPTMSVMIEPVNSVGDRFGSGRMRLNGSFLKTI